MTTFDPLTFVGVAATHSADDPVFWGCSGTITAQAPIDPAYADDRALAGTCTVGTPDPTFDAAGRVCYAVNPDGTRRVVAPTDPSALVVASATPTPGTHRPVIDLDVPARLVPSSTPGHAHLYIDVDVPWKAYVQVLAALAAAGIVEHGYVHASEGRGASFARLPWVRKPAGFDHPSPYGLVS